MDQVVLLHNAKAGTESWSRRDLTQLVRRAGFKPRYHELKAALRQPKLLDRGEFVIVAGGDGSIIKAARALLGRKRPLAPLPLGTANNIARGFDLPLKPADVVRGWRKPTRRAFDVGAIHGPKGRRHFIEGVGLGLVSRTIAVLDDIDEIAAHELAQPTAKLHRDACVAAALAHEMQPLEVQLTLDGRDASNAFLLLEILNIRRAGPAVELAPRANPSDGRFDIVSTNARQRARLLEILKARLRDDEPSRRLTTRQAREITLRVATACDLRIDDDTQRIAADTTVEIEILPAALEFLLPGA